MSKSRKRMNRHKSRKPKMTDERSAFIDVHCGIAEDFPDGAYFAYMEEQGIGVEELLETSDDEAV